jgi:Anti-sigma factor NepR
MKSSLRPDTSELIGKRLQKCYDTGSQQALPDQFKILLAQLDKVSAKQNKTQLDNSRN